MLADSHLPLQIGVGEAAIHHHLDRVVVFAAAFACERRNLHRVEVGVRNKAALGDDFVIRVLLAFQDSYVGGELAGDAGERHRRCGVLDACRGAKRVENPIDPLREAVDVGSLSPACADVQRQDVSKLEAGRHATQRFKASQKQARA